jgi:hypothetical protein
MGKDLPETEHVMYTKGMNVEVTTGDVLLYKTVSYFDRTWQHYASHRQTPSSGKRGDPAVVQNGRVIYFAHPVFSQYQINTPLWCRTLVKNAIDILLPEPLVSIDGPASLQATINRQADLDRFVLHLLHYIPERRGDNIDVIEDVIPIYEIAVSVRVDRAVKSVKSVPGGESLPFRHNKGRIEFVVPELTGHQMVELDYRK